MKNDDKFEDKNDSNVRRTHHSTIISNYFFDTKESLLLAKTSFYIISCWKCLAGDDILCRKIFTYQNRSSLIYAKIIVAFVGSLCFTNVVIPFFRAKCCWRMLWKIGGISEAERHEWCYTLCQLLLEQCSLSWKEVDAWFTFFRTKWCS